MVAMTILLASIIARYTLNIFTISLIVLIFNIPFIQGLSAIDFIRSFTGDISVFLVLFSVLSTASIYGLKIPILSIGARLFVIFFGGIVLLGALNILPFDIYALDPQYRLIIASSVAIVGFFIDRLLGYLYLLSMAYFLIMPSENIFDYFVDPLLWAYMIVSVISYIFVGKRV